MTQDLQPQTAPVSQNLPESASPPVTDTASVDVQSAPVDVQHAPIALVPKADPIQSDSPQAGAGAARAQALEIAELCQLAGQSSRIASFLAQGTTAGQVRQALLLSRTQSEEISSLIHPDAVKPTAQASSDDASALLAAVRKLTGAS